MRHLALFALPLLFVACDRQPAESESAVHVDVSFTDFNAGCISVLAQDASASDKQEVKEVEVFDRGTRKANFAVFRKKDWGRTIQITVSARERSCAGPEVASRSETFTLDKAGTQTLAVSLTAQDEDKDGYVAASGRGTDCDDTHSGSNPGVTAEVCDGRDNDCRNGIDDGLTLTDFFLDGDGDGVGAGDANKACSAPPNHVTASGDCDDTTDTRTPGKAEVCDEVDNDCDNTPDDGLATRAYHPDGDGDGFGTQSGAVQKCRAPMGYVEATAVFDCNDASVAVKPGATETCNNVDDNCVNGVDEGVKTTWHRDVDGDGVGRASETQQSCTAPAGYVAATVMFDCNDDDNEVEPGNPELCNGKDDNCVSGTDESFKIGDSCGNGTCTGKFACTSTTTSACNAPTPVNYYTDADGDGEGAGSASPICPPAPAPSGKVANNTDCDDTDPHNRRGATEVCDDRDNNCANGKSDETAVCGGKGWKVLTDNVTTARDWNTVAVKASGGGPVWIAGNMGALAVRSATGTSFIDHHQQCGNITWNAAWVRPSDSKVFLAGALGTLAVYNGLDACVTVSTTNATGEQTSDRPLTGIVGIETGSVTTVYAVNDHGAIFTWTPGNNPVFKFKRAMNDPYRDIHGATSSQLFIAAVADGGNDRPELHLFNGSEQSEHAINGVSSPNNKSLRGIWAWDATHAYAVGGQGIVLKWDGNTTWNFVNLTTGSTTADLTSVVAFDDSSVYVTDSEGKVRRATPGGWVLHYNGTPVLKDIAAASPQNIWAVGNGVVVHFPE